MPSSLYGKYFIQSGSVEKYSRRLKPYQRGFFAGSRDARGVDFVAVVLWPASTVPANSKGETAADAIVTADFRRVRRVMRFEPGAASIGSAPWLLLISIVSPKRCACRHRSRLVR